MSHRIVGVTGCVGADGDLRSLDARLTPALEALDRALDGRRWVALWERLGASGDATLLFDELVRRYAEPHRAYHVLSHVRACLGELDRVSPAPPDVDLLELALWYHDIVYDPRAPHDNEAKSAACAESAMHSMGLEGERVRRVVRLIEATKTHEGSVDPLAPLLVDIDLSILGAESEAFANYERDIRTEYRWVPEMIYRRERGRILRGFLDREQLFATPDFRARYEARARANLKASLQAKPPGAPWVLLRKVWARIWRGA